MARKKKEQEEWQLPAKFVEPPIQLPMSWTHPEPEYVQALAASGMTNIELAYHLGAPNEKSVEERLKEDPEFADMIAKGRAQGIQNVKNAVYSKACTGDIPACRLFLEYTGSLNKKAAAEALVTNNTLNVSAQFVQPQEMAPEAFDKLMQSEMRKRRKAEDVVDAEVAT